MSIEGMLLAEGSGTLDEVVAANEHLWPLALVLLAVIGAFVWAARQRAKAIAKLGNASADMDACVAAWASTTFKLVRMFS